MRDPIGLPSYSILAFRHSVTKINYASPNLALRAQFMTQLATITIKCLRAVTVESHYNNIQDLFVCNEGQTNVSRSATIVPR